VAAPGVVAREAHGLHHGLGARHVERHLIQAGDLAQARDVGRHTWMVGTEHHAQPGGALQAIGHAGLVEIVAKHIDAVGAGEIDQAIAVEVFQLQAIRGRGKGRHGEALPQVGAELERHAVGAGELQVRKLASRGLGHRGTAGVAPGVQVRQARQAVLSALHHIGGGAVGRKEALGVVGAAGEPACQALGHARVAGQRRVLGHRKLQASACQRREHEEPGHGGRPRGHGSEVWKLGHVDRQVMEPRRST